MEPASLSESSSSQSKKRKPTSSEAPPAAKKAKRPSAAKSRKSAESAAAIATPSSSGLSPSSDKENTDLADTSGDTMVADESIVVVAADAEPKAKAPRKPKAKESGSTTKRKSKTGTDAAGAAAAAAAPPPEKESSSKPVTTGFIAVNVAEALKQKEQKKEAASAKAASASTSNEKAGQDKKESVPKAPKAAKETKIPKVPKADKPPKETKEKVSKDDKAPKEKEKVPKGVKAARGTEIKEWKAYEPKNPAITKFLQAMEPVRQAPKVTEPPFLEYIEISHPLQVIHDRLIVREFMLRFEKSIKIVPKYVNIVNNPNSDWTDLTYRSLIVSLLRLIHADDYPPMDWHLLDAGIKELEKTPPDDPKLWGCLCSILDGVIDTSRFTDFTQDKTRLAIIVRLVGLAMSSQILRERIEQDAVNIKKEEKSTQDQLKAIKAEWDATKQEISKLRLTAPAEERTNLDSRYSVEQAFMRKQIAMLEARHWFKKRKLCPRSKPLGVDAKGNTYWLYIQRDRDAEDWGRWIVIEKGYGLPHPFGSIPPQLLDTSNTDASPDEQLSAENLEQEIKKRVWYAVSTSQEATALADWIQSTAELVIYERATRQMPASPVRQRLQAVEVPMSPSMRNLLIQDPKEARRLFNVSEASSERIPPQDLVTREGIAELCKAIRKVGGYWQLEEEGLGQGKLPV
ncbi:hypothetical protein BDZ91DRAFT_387955 [Kalaharituber pfeilii]|nr:hypothetical protein BDZ91DRAFT_387955 [Kalaharituber pfeilii]